MISKHTPGPWEVAEENGELFVQVVNQPASCHPMFDRYRIIHGHVGGDPTENPTPDLGTPEANARLIAAAPDGLDTAIFVYEALLRHPVDAWRIRADGQQSLCHLRGFIAKATGRSEQEVQEFHEGIVAGELACAT